jgi:hypothetical protein
VQQPINIKFDKSNTNISYYIQNAGGFGVDPWKKRINIRYQNGRLASTKRFLFIRKYPKVNEGCTIFVPKKIAKERKNNGAEIFSYALSAITTLATLIVLSRSLNK